MSKKHFVVNVGLARCGTTATEKFFRDFAKVSSPKNVKGLKYFLKPDPITEQYIRAFQDPDKAVLFESSPHYCHVGLERHAEVLERIATLRNDGHMVTILFCMRNLLSRAFSHYWHDISAHYARRGKIWAVRSDDDPRRYAQLYAKSFDEELQSEDTRGKFLPDVGAMLSLAMKTFGPENVRIAHTKHLDDGINDLLGQAGLETEEPINLPRLPGATAPVYFYGGTDGREVELETPDGPKTLSIPAQTCVMFCRHHSELLTADRFDLEAIIAAAQTWSESYDTADLPEEVKTYLTTQQAILASMPEECFLGDSREKLLEEMGQIPPVLKIKPMAAPYTKVKEHIWSHQAIAAAGDGKVIVGRRGRLFLHFDMNEVLPQHLGKLLLSPQEIEKWRLLLESRTAWCNARGIPYAMLFAPDTHAVYPEDLAELDGRPGIRPILQVLEAYKGDNAHYPLDAMRAARGQGEVCHVTDSHWSGFGAYAAYRDVIGKIPGNLRRLGDDPTEVRIFDQMLVGDLGNKFTPHRTGRYTECAATRSQTTKVWNNGVTNRGHMSFWTGNPSSMPRGLLLTDSYGWKFQRYLAESFSSMFVVHSPLLEKEAVERFRPDVVVSLMAERFVPKVPDDEAGKTALEMALVKDPDVAYPNLESMIVENAAG